MSRLKTEYREPFKRMVVGFSNHALAREIFGKDNSECRSAINRAMEGRKLFPRLLAPITEWIEARLQSAASKSDPKCIQSGIKEGVAAMKDTQDFVNPTGYWEHQGAYSVELTDDAKTDIVFRSVVIEGRVATVTHGRIKQVMGGIQFYSLEQPFCWSYKFIKTIRDGSGKLLWVNWDYR